MIDFGLEGNVKSDNELREYFVSCVFKIFIFLKELVVLVVIIYKI